MTPGRRSSKPRPYYTEGAVRDSAPEILEPPSCVAGSGNESSRISTVRTPKPRFVLAQFLTFASAAEPPSFPRSLVRREQPQVDVNGHPPRSKSARSDSSRMGEQGTHLLLLKVRLKVRSGDESQPELLEPRQQEFSSPLLVEENSRPQHERASRFVTQLLDDRCDVK